MGPVSDWPARASPFDQEEEGRPHITLVEEKLPLQPEHEQRRWAQGRGAAEAEGFGQQQEEEGLILSTPGRTTSNKNRKQKTGVLEEWPWLRHCKTKDQLRWQARLEWRILRREWPWLLGALLAEYVGAGPITNLARWLRQHYYWQQRQQDPGPLPDLLHMLLPHRLPLGLPLLLPACLAVLLAGCFVLLPLAQLVLVLPPHWCKRPGLALREGRGGAAGGGGGNRPAVVLVVPVPSVLVWKRLSVALVALQLLRWPAMLLTVAPSPSSPPCRLPAYYPSSLPAGLLALSASSSSCSASGLLFSGGLSHALLAVLLLSSAFPGAPLPLRLLAWLLLLAVVVLSLLLRATYSTDALVALYVAWAIGALLLPPSRSQWDEAEGEGRLLLLLERRYRLRVNDRSHVGLQTMATATSSSSNSNRTQLEQQQQQQEEAEGEQADEDGNFYYLPPPPPPPGLGGLLLEDRRPALCAYHQLPW